MNARPAKTNPSAAVWNMPVRIEMYEKPAAKLENDPSERFSSCLYPNDARSCASVWTGSLIEPSWA